MKVISPKRLMQSVFPTVRNGSIFNASSLDLQFARTKTLDPRVTFTRASSGTYVDSQGVIRTATTNLLLRSEEFDNAYWSKTNSTVTANATTAPNGTLTAEKLITNSGASGGRVNVSITATAGTPVTLSCYAKQGETNIFSLFISDGITGRAAEFNLTTGTVSGTPTAGMTASIQPVGDGWYRCVATVAGASLSGTTRSLRIVQNVVANDGTSGLFIWGAQLEESSTVGEYIPTTSTINSAPRFDHAITSSVTNLLLRSEDLNNAVWSAVNTTVNTTAITAPNGTLTGNLLLAASTANNTKRRTQTISSIAGQTYTFSVYLKKASDVAPFGGISLATASSTTPYVTARWNLNTGVNTLGTASSGYTFISQSIQAVGDGWYRCSVTGIIGTDADLRVNVYATDSGTAITANLSGARPVVMAIDDPVIYVWGAQLEQSSTTGEYVQTTSAPATASKTESLGLLVEEQRTNLSLQSDNLSDVYWAKVDCTITANQFTAPDGTLTADLWTNIPTAGGAVNNSMAKDASIRTYTASMWVNGTSPLFTMTLDFGGTVNRGRVQYNLATNTIVGTTNTGNFTGTSGTITPYANGWARLTLTTTTSTGTTIRFRSFFGTGGESVYVWGAQVEEGAFPTSYIPTTTAAVTRSADVASITGSNFSSWYRQDEGTVFGDFSNYSNTGRIFSLNTDATSNRISISRGTASGGNINAVVNVGGVVQVNFLVLAASIASFTGNRVAFSYRTSDFAGSVNGLTPVTQGTGTLPTVTQATLGNGEATGSNPLNGTIKRLTYFPTRLANETLQQITQ